MADIVLATLNARYVHCAFGLRYLLANLGDLQSRAVMLEFTTQQPTLEILDAILECQPLIVGLGVYIWNVDETTRLVADLKRIRPDIVVVLGGPEVSYEPDEQAIVKLADHVIAGEADLEFTRFCRATLTSVDQGKPSTVHEMESLPQEVRPRFIAAPIPLLDDILLPYELYSNDDIAHRVIYVEASRGCPFTCEFCLSALEIPVRQFPIDQFLASLKSLLQRGARQFKFVDRTFNLNLRVSRAILSFFLARYEPGLFLHFEMIPDRLPDSLKDLIIQFPAGSLQFEVGIQTFNETVCELISRHQDNRLVEQNLTWLRQNTGVHVHADLIVGLPGESLESFSAGFDRLVGLAPHEIQVGILKRLRGTPITRHDAEWEMVYSPHPPFEVLSTKLMDFTTIQELRRFAKYWDAVANSGNFVESLSLVWTDHCTSNADPNCEDIELMAQTATHRDSELNQSTRCEIRLQTDGISEERAKRHRRSPFSEFRRLVDWLYQHERKTSNISLSRLVELLFKYLTEVRNLPVIEVASIMWRDYQRGGRSDKPKCLRPFLDEIAATSRTTTTSETGTPKRQSRHLNH